MKRSPQNYLLIDHHADSVSFCLYKESRVPAPLTLSRQIRCHPTRSSIQCTLAGEPAGNLRAAVSAAENEIRWDDTVVVFGAPSDPFADRLGSLASALKSLEFLIRRAPRRLVVQTRSPFILFAVPLLQSFSASEVRLAIEAADDSLHHRLLPSFPRPSERMETLDALLAARIPVSLQVSPVLTRSESTVQLKQLVAIIRDSGRNRAEVKQIYPIDSLLSARLDPALLSLYRARRRLVPHAHRLLQNALLRPEGRSMRAEQILQKSA